MLRKEVQGEWFDAIARGVKRTEGRPCTSASDHVLYRNITPGILIVFVNSDDRNMCIVRRITSVIIYGCLSDYLDKEWKAASGDLYTTKEATMAAYLAIKRNNGTIVFNKSVPVAAIKF